MNFPRASGVLLHPTSLPGGFGVGDLGPEAYKFVDFLASAGQSLWQVLPLGPTGYGDSPYACYSAFAGNTLLISPERLIKENLISETELAALPQPPEGPVDFAFAHETKNAILSQAFASYQRISNADLRSEFETFTTQNVLWLEDYALFRALKTAH